MQDPDDIARHLQRAGAANIIAPLDDAAVAKAIDALRALAPAELLGSQASTPVAAARLMDLARLTRVEKAAVLKTYATSGKRPDRFLGGRCGPSA